ncbi:putative membrane protein [Candidatus Methanophagaceae archaeon]|nr:putative membrane protein [Methanophagales archaeon]
MSGNTQNNPMQLIVAAFQDEDGAERALNELKAAKKDNLIKIENAAIIRKDMKGKLHIKEAAERKEAGKGVGVGLVVGAALGVLTGGATLVLAAGGAVVGGLAAKLHDTGFDDKRLETMGRSLKPGTSAIVALIEHKWVGELAQALSEAGADMLTQAISDDIATQLKEDREVAYTVIASDEGVASDRVVVGKDDTVDDRGANKLADK